MRWSIFLFLCFGFSQSAPSLDDESKQLLEAEDRVLLGEEEGRLIDEDGRLITYSSGGDFTLVNIPISKSAASISFNDTKASTISALGNAALLVGGLYILSGLKGAIASDPLGLKRRLSPEYPPIRINHKTSQMEMEDRPQVKRRRRPRPSRKQKHRSEHRHQRPEDNEAQERQGLRFRLPTLRLNRLRMPTLPPINFPQLRPFSRLRRPSLPASRPAIASRPRPVRPSPDRPAPESTPLAPVLQNSFAPQQSSFTPQQSSFTPQQDSFSPQQDSFSPQQSSFSPVIQGLSPMEEEFRTAPQQEQNFGAFDNDFEIQEEELRSQDNFRNQGQNFGAGFEEEEFRSQENFRNQGQNFGAAFDSPFDNDPFSEFQSQNFGDDASFRTLLDSQFDNQFDFKKI